MMVLLIYLMMMMILVLLFSWLFLFSINPRLVRRTMLLRGLLLLRLFINMDRWSHSLVDDNWRFIVL